MSKFMSVFIFFQTNYITKYLASYNRLNLRMEIDYFTQYEISINYFLDLLIKSIVIMRDDLIINTLNDFHDVV